MRLRDLMKLVLGQREASTVPVSKKGDGKFHCLDCNGTEFLKGPHGGNAINFACKNCWARYNDMTPFSIERYGRVEPDNRQLFQRGPYVPGPGSVR